MSAHFLDSLPVYRPYGDPAFATIQFKMIPNNGDTVTIAGTVLTYGVDFSGATTVVRAAQALTAAIRSDIAVSYLQSDKQPVRPFCAFWYNDTVFLFATQPGTGGNALTLATSNTAAFNLSGATFGGGINGSPMVSSGAASGPLTDGSGTITTGGTAQQVFAANSSRKYMLIQNQSTDTLYVNFGTAAVVGQPSMALQPANGANQAGGSLSFEDNFVPNTTVSIIGATTGDAFVAKQG